jgi:hypothetical protein
MKVGIDQAIGNFDPAPGADQILSSSIFPSSALICVISAAICGPNSSLQSPFHGPPPRPLGQIALAMRVLLWSGF